MHTHTHARTNTVSVKRVVMGTLSWYLPLAVHTLPSLAEFWQASSAHFWFVAGLLAFWWICMVDSELFQIPVRRFSRKTKLSPWFSFFRRKGSSYETRKLKGEIQKNMPACLHQMNNSWQFQNKQLLVLQKFLILELHGFNSWVVTPSAEWSIFEMSCTCFEELFDSQQCISWICYYTELTCS